MKRTALFFACAICVYAQFRSGPTGERQSLGNHLSGAKISPAAGNSLRNLPLSFEVNQGQADPRVKFLVRIAGYTLFVTSGEAVFAGRDGSVERMKLIGSQRNVRTEPLDKQPGISNYFIGNDPSKWHSNIPNYGRVALRGVYPGIDLIFYGKERQLEYDWMVAPGADPKQIRVKWEGPHLLTKNANGDLSLGASLVEHKPTILQEGKRIAGEFIVRGREVAFEVARYDAAKPLVIDPVLVYSTYLGGNKTEENFGIALDSADNTYVVGLTNSPDFPTANPLQAANHTAYPKSNAFVSKINAAGSALVYSTYLGGSNSDDGLGIAVDASGNAYVTGSTSSSDFPMANALQSVYGGGSNDAFVTKINAAGSALVYSTYLGGSADDQSNAIALDSLGDAYVAGSTASTNFPTANPIQASFGGVFDGFVAEINAAGSALVYSTYLGGSNSELAVAIAIDGSGSAYVTGYTESNNFPTAQPLQANFGGGTHDGFVTKINATGSALVYSTYLGGSGDDYGNGIAVDGLGNAYVTGSTTSTNFPTANPLQASNHGVAGNPEGNALVTKINPTGSALVYSTYLGGSYGDAGFVIAVDTSGNAYVGGSVGSSDFPLVNPLQDGTIPVGDFGAFVAEINPSGSSLLFSTFLDSANCGGIAVDGFGNIHVAGIANGMLNAVFPLVNPLQPALGGGAGDVYVLLISPFSLPFDGGAVLSADGGSGSLNLTFPEGYAWTASTTASWITFVGSPSGSSNGTLSYQVAPNTGAGRSAIITVGILTFNIEQQAASINGLTYIGSMPHIAAQENWTTTFTLVDKGTTPATARLSFFNDPAGLLTLPLTLPQQPPATGPLLAASIDNPISSNASLIVTTAGPQTPPVQIGSAQLSSDGNVDGFAIFHLIPGAQEAVVPMETRNAGSYILAYDNTNGVVLGVSVANVSPQAGNVGVIVRDDSGAPIGSGSIAMQANGHMSFVLSDPTTGFPVTADKRGTVEFDTPTGGQISVLGIRTTPLGTTTTLTTIPVLANVGTSGGSIAHIATGNGWQTTFVLVNTGSTAANVNLNFFADVTGVPLPLPISFPQGGRPDSTASSVSQQLATGATLLVLSEAPASDSSPTTGSAQLTTNGNVSGFVIFRYNPNGQEAVVPLESRNANGFLIAFDNTSGTATGIALNNVSAQSVSVPVIVRNDAGVQVATDTLNLAAHAHLAFTLGSSLAGFKYIQAANIRGTIEFDTPSGAQIGALGIRIPVAHTFTTLPALAK